MPPGTGIVHQMNLEYLGQVVFASGKHGGAPLAYPDSLVGTDSHTTMINGLGVLGWGVGGIEAEAAMLGQPLSMLIPEVVGFKLHGKLPAGATATDLVLTVTEILRKKKVVGKFVEFYGAGLSSLSLADRATIANMAPEYGATVGFFPVDAETLKYLRLTGRDEHHVKLVEAYSKAQGMFRDDNTPDPQFTDTVVARPRHRGAESRGAQAPAGPRAALEVEDGVQRAWARRWIASARSRARSQVEQRDGGERRARSSRPSAVATEPAEVMAKAAGVSVKHNGQQFALRHGAVVIAAITSCTNTSNPSVMLAAGLLAKKRGGARAQDASRG